MKLQPTNCLKIRRGFALIFVIVLITLFSSSSYSILTKFDNDYAAAHRSFDTTSAYYWQEGRLRLARYKFGVELVKNGANWDTNSQVTKFNAILNEVFPQNPNFNWRDSLYQTDGGYVSQGTYTP
jgi:hypothetical protein